MSADAVLEAARAAGESGGRAAACELLDAALREEPDRVERARLQRARIAAGDDLTLARAEACLTEAAGVELLAPGLAARLYADAALHATGGDVELAAVAARRAAELVPEDDGGAQAHADLAAATVAILQGRGRDGRALLDSLSSLEADNAAELVALTHQAGVGFFYLDRHDEARRFMATAADLARRTNARRELGTVLDTIAIIEVHMGRYAAAEGKSLEALRLAREQQDVEQTASCLTTLAAIDAIRGRERQCRARTAEAAEISPADHVVQAWIGLVHALLHLGLDRAAAVVADAPRVAAVFDAVGGHESTEVSWLPLVVEAHSRLGDRESARIAAGRLGEIAAQLDTPIAHTLHARCLGLVSDGAEAWDSFERALVHHRDANRPFETARTELCYGERLRRARRRDAARRQLESAAATFERLRATPWLERARRELAAVAGRRPASASSTLTAHERTVAELVAQGATNKEVAAALFVTPKTIEHHLTSIYAKLGIRSRTELVRELLRERG